MLDAELVGRSMLADVGATSEETQVMLPGKSSDESLIGLGIAFRGRRATRPAVPAAKDRPDREGAAGR